FLSSQRASVRCRSPKTTAARCEPIALTTNANFRLAAACQPVKSAAITKVGSLPGRHAHVNCESQDVVVVIRQPLAFYPDAGCAWVGALRSVRITSVTESA